MSGLYLETRLVLIINTHRLVVFWQYHKLFKKKTLNVIHRQEKSRFYL